MSAAGSCGMPSWSDSRRNFGGEVPAFTTVTASPLRRDRLHGAEMLARNGRKGALRIDTTRVAMLPLAASTRPI